MTATYDEFLRSKALAAPAAGFAVSDGELPSMLFPWQRQVVRWALMRGRAAVFADTGLGKTGMQLAIGDAVARHTGRPFLILTPLAVAAQTIREAQKFGIPAVQVREPDGMPGGPCVVVTNYERFERFEPAVFGGVALDESSLLKNYMGTTKRRLVEAFAGHEFRYAFTATPAPNDHMELGNHSEFLGVLTSSRMLSRFFINDTSQTGVYRLKGHAEGAFWEWVATWAVALRTPADLLDASGQPYDASQYRLPALDIVTHTVAVDHATAAEDGMLFRGGALSATNLHREMRRTAADRAERAADLVRAEPDESWIIWCNTNYEADELRARLPEAVEVRGNDRAEVKEERLDAFSRGEIRCLITKPGIAGHGMNWQHCARMVFVGLSYSYEDLYQALRRSYRFGQTREVRAHLIAAESEGAVRDSLTRKQADHERMQSAMAEAMRAVQGHVSKEAPLTIAVGEVAEGDGWRVTNGDCVEVVRAMETASVDFSIYSPPFSNLYIYTDDPRDMGNTADDAEFFAHFAHLLPELARVTRPGRLMAVHCKQLPLYAGRDGVAGLRDFRGEINRAASAAGWTLHSEVTIWKCPVTEMQRTKANGLLYKTIQRNASFSRQGMAEYLQVFRRWPADEAESALEVPVVHDPADYPLDQWQQDASPVWMDVDQTRVLNVQLAREDRDEKHICPLQLDVIERAIRLWTNPGDLVLSPFTGIGSEGVVSLRMGRRFVGAELKPAYWRYACRNLRDATAQTSLNLFGEVAA